MDGIVQPLNLHKYLFAARRRWWLILSGALLAGVIGIGGARMEHLATAELLFRESPEITLAGQALDGEFDIPRRSAAEYAAPFRAESFKDKFRRDNNGATVSVEPAVEKNGVTIAVTSRSANQAKSLLGATVNAVKASRSKEASETIGGALRLSAQRRATLERQSAVMTGELRRLPAGSGVADALARERAETHAQISRIETYEALLTELLANDGAATVTSKVSDPTASSRTTSTIPTVMLFAVLGALLTAAVVALASMFDRTIRTRSDIDSALGEGATIAVVGDQDDDTAWGLALAIFQALGPTGSVASVLAVASERSSTKVETNVSALGGRIQSMLAILRPGLTEVTLKADTFRDIHLAGAVAADACVVVAMYGITSTDDLQATIQILAGAGAKPTGVALAMVPAAERRHANR